MMSASDRRERWFRALAALAAGFILYGSLYPFRFRGLPEGAGILEALISAWAQPVASRGDVLANLLLYMPFGLLCAAALPRAVPVARLLLPALLGTFLSLGIEVAQLYVPGRSSSLWDVFCNAVGTEMGAACALLGGARAIDQRPRILEPVPALLVLAWLGYAFFPYLPSIDLQAWRDNLKPLLLHPTLEPARTLRLLVTWTSAALLAEAALGRERARLAVPLSLAAALVAQVVIPGLRLDLAEMLGIGLTPLLCGVLRGQGWAAPVMAGGMLGAVLLERLEPFTFAAISGEFGWIPFRSLINGSLEAGFQAMLFKLFLQGATLWWLLRAGVRLPLAAGLQAALVFGASLVQTHIPGRSAEITDTLLVLALLLVFLVVRPVVAPPRRDASWRMRATARLSDRQLGAAMPVRRSRRRREQAKEQSGATP